MIRDPKILVVMIILPLLMFVVMGEAFSYASGKALEQTLRNVKVLFVDADGGWSSKLLLETISSSVGVVQVISGVKGFDKNLVPLASEGEYDVIVIVPPGFTNNIESGMPTKIEVVSIIRGLSFASTAKSSLTHKLIEMYREALVKKWLKQAFPDKSPEVLLRPFITDSQVLVKDEVLDEELWLAIVNRSTMLFIGPLILLSIASSIAAASIGVEKEERTLEVLLSFPVKRSAILFSKAFSTLMVALVGTLSMGAGLLYYMDKVIATPIAEQVSTGPLSGFSLMVELIGPATLVLLCFSIFIALFLVLSLTLVVGSLASNVREAQAMAGYLWIPLFLPLIALMFIDLSSLSEAGRLVISAAPLLTPLIVLKGAFEGTGTLGLLSLSFNIAYLALTFYIGSKWFEGERVLVSKVKPPFRKRTN